MEIIVIVIVVLISEGLRIVIMLMVNNRFGMVSIILIKCIIRILSVLL